MYSYEDRIKAVDYISNIINDENKFLIMNPGICYICSIYKGFGLDNVIGLSKM